MARWRQVNQPLLRTTPPSWITYSKSIIFQPLPQMSFLLTFPIFATHNRPPLPFTDKPPYSRTIYKFTRPRNYPSPQHNLPLHPSLNSVITSLTTKNNPLLIWRLFILPAALLLQKPAVPAMQCNHQQGSIHPSIHSLP